MARMTPEQFAELKQTLRGFYGSGEYFNLGFPCKQIFITEGIIKYLADKAQCWWLITDLACYLPEILRGKKYASHPKLKDRLSEYQREIFQSPTAGTIFAKKLT